MTYYGYQVEAISKEIYSNDYLLRQIIQAKTYIDKNFQYAISLEDICKQVFISKSHLLRSFKTLYGRTPHQYLISVRINNARELLRKNVSIADACLSVGFDSIPSFTALFKKMYGVTPAAIQNKG
jgi:AraC-like DNA-binding protein